MTRVCILWYDICEQMRIVFLNNLGIYTCYFSIKSIHFGYSVELLGLGCSNEYTHHHCCSPRRGCSNEYSQHMFLWRTIEKYPLIISKYPSYLFHTAVALYLHVKSNWREWSCRQRWTSGPLDSFACAFWWHGSYFCPNTTWRNDRESIIVIVLRQI